jgi:hypothetical protein
LPQDVISELVDGANEDWTLWVIATQKRAWA